VRTCEITMSDNGRGPTGIETYWKCGKPAKAVIFSKLHGKHLDLCGVHARAHDRVAERCGRELSKPLEVK